MADTRVYDRTKERIGELMNALNVRSEDVFTPSDCNAVIDMEYAVLGRVLEARLKTIDSAVAKAPDPGAMALYYLGTMSQAASEAMIKIGNLKELRDLMKKRSELGKGKEGS